MTDLPIPDDELFDTVAELITQLTRMYDRVQDSYFDAWKESHEKYSQIR